MERPSGRQRGSTRRAVRSMVAAVLAVGVVAAGCGRGDQEIGTTPGYNDTVRAVDDSPFEIPEATDPGSSTTLPGPAPTLPLTDDLNDQLRPMLPNGLRPGQLPPTPMPTPRAEPVPTPAPDPVPAEPATTTTLPPTSPGAISGSRIESICGMTEYFQSLVSLFVNPQANSRDKIQVVLANLRAYRSLIPANAEAAAKVVWALIDDLAGRVERARYNMNDRSVVALTSKLLSQDPSTAAVVDAYRQLEFVELATCGG